MKKKPSKPQQPRARAPSSPSLARQNAQLQARLAEAEETLRAIRQGEVDALVVAGPKGDQVFTLQGAETPYRFLVEELNEGALLLLPEGTILYANTRFAQLADVPLHQVIGASWEWFFDPADLPRVKALLQAARSAGAKQEFRLRLPSGSKPVEVSVASMSREGVEGFSALVTDLTERKAAEEALRSSNARLRELVTELEQFSYSISHDMRAPLRAMKSFTDILREDCEACGRAENSAMLERIGAAASRLDGLIQGSLDYARVVKEEFELEPVDLARLIPSLVETYPNLLPQKSHIELQEHLPVVLGNEAALTQVFSNLLGNAVKFVAPGQHPRVRIWAEPVKESSASAASTSPAAASPAAPAAAPSPTPAAAPCVGRVRVWVEDHGIGIAERAQSRIFAMFERATNKYEGTGIGLAVVRKVVERMGGKVGVQSQEGQGSRFWVELKTPG